MLKKWVVVGIIGFTSFAYAKKEMTEKTYPEALACLEKMNAAHPYNWLKGASPYAYDAKTKDHFIVLGKENAFVRFGATKPQKCDFNMDHNSTRDCVKIMDESGGEVVTMKFKYADTSKTACDTKNPNSTTKYKYNAEKACADISMKELGQILQKQILVNTEKLIVEKNLSRADFDSQYRKDCESVHNKIWDGIGSDYGATVSYAVKKAKDESAKVQRDDSDKGTAGQKEGVSGTGEIQQ